MTNKRISVICLVLLFGIVVLLLIAALKPASKKPNALDTVHRQVSFILYTPSAEWSIEPQSVGYHDEVVQFTSSRATIKLTISEQATPSVFNDVPQYYPTLLDKLNQYTNFGTVNGTVYLTKPKELNGQQQAVLNNNGTLMFVHPNNNLTNDDWRRFFNDVQTLKP